MIKNIIICLGEVLRAQNSNAFQLTLEMKQVITQRRYSLINLTILKFFYKSVYFGHIFSLLQSLKIYK